MNPAVATRFRLLASALSVILLIALLVAFWLWRRVYASLPILNGESFVPGLVAPVTLERDALGIPTLSASNRADLSRSLGWVHAQDRFFQMDLLRRSSAGELAEIFGKAALPLDKAKRIHRFRKVAEAALEKLPSDERIRLQSYCEGVNAGLKALRDKPFEYLVLRLDPAPWKPEDSLLVGYSMWLDLQDSTGAHEKTLATIRDVLGSSFLAFFGSSGSSWDAPLDGSHIDPARCRPRVRSTFETKKLPRCSPIRT